MARCTAQETGTNVKTDELRCSPAVNSWASEKDTKDSNYLHKVYEFLRKSTRRAMQGEKRVRVETETGDKNGH